MLADVQGQDEGVRFLRKVVDQKLTSPLLLVGEEGVGRRFSALQAIKELSCTEGRTSGCPCIACTQIDMGMYSDLTVITVPEDKRIDVETIRTLIEQTWSYPSMGNFKCFIIDGADRMTPAAANAFLKTLEEPPPTVRFFLISESYDLVLPTIRSRCAKIAYRPLTESLVLSMVQRFEKDVAKALVYARMGEGSVGRATRYWSSGRLGLRDRVFSSLRLALGGELPSLFSSIDAIGAADLPLSLRFFDHLLHDLLMVRHAPDRLINLDLQEDLVQISGKVSPEVVAKFARGLQTVRERYRRTRINLAFHMKALFAETFVGS